MWIVLECSNFFIDFYVVQGLQRFLGEECCSLQVVGIVEFDCVFDEGVVVLLLMYVDFCSGWIYDMVGLMQCVYDVGVVVIWDFVYSVGVLFVEFDVCNVDFVVGCGYKYLNGGFGVLLFVYVVFCYQNLVQQLFFGWMGYVVLFVFDLDYCDGDGIFCFFCGMFLILLLSVFDVVFDVFVDVELYLLWVKLIGFCDFFQGVVFVSDVL